MYSTKHWWYEKLLWIWSFIANPPKLYPAVISYKLISILQQILQNNKNCFLVCLGISFTLLAELVHYTKTKIEALIT